MPENTPLLTMTHRTNPHKLSRSNTKSNLASNSLTLSPKSATHCGRSPGDLSTWAARGKQTERRARHVSAAARSERWEARYPGGRNVCFSTGGARAVAINSKMDAGRRWRWEMRWTGERGHWNEAGRVRRGDGRVACITVDELRIWRPTYKYDIESAGSKMQGLTSLFNTPSAVIDGVVHKNMIDRQETDIDVQCGVVD
jgi:hypothetical protein